MGDLLLVWCPWCRLWKPIGKFTGLELTHPALLEVKDGATYWHQTQRHHCDACLEEPDSLRPDYIPRRDGYKHR